MDGHGWTWMDMVTWCDCYEWVCVCMQVGSSRSGSRQGGESELCTQLISAVLISVISVIVSTVINSEAVEDVESKISKISKSRVVVSSCPSPRCNSCERHPGNPWQRRMPRRMQNACHQNVHFREFSSPNFAKLLGAWYECNASESLQSSKPNAIILCFSEPQSHRISQWDTNGTPTSVIEDGIDPTSNSVAPGSFKFPKNKHWKMKSSICVKS